MNTQIFGHKIIASYLFAIMISVCCYRMVMIPENSVFSYSVDSPFWRLAETEAEQNRGVDS